MDFSQTRSENDNTLLTRVTAIRSGEDLEVLEPFAKAYLGLYYDIDNQIKPIERIDLLVNSELSEAIKQGLRNVLLRSELPSIEEITNARLQHENLTVGYAVLAGMSICAEQNMEDIYRLPEKTLAAAVGFHHFISTFHEDTWYHHLLVNSPGISAQSLLAMWQILIDNKNDFLPGLRSLLNKPELIPVFRQVAVPLLTYWTHCRHRDLEKLLSLSIETIDGDILLDAAMNMLQKTDLMNLRNQVYWQATAFLLAPEQQGQAMNNFMGQEKIKLLPMLDFIMPLLDTREGGTFSLSAEGYGFLLRCLAQKFTPQMDMYDNLSEITLKVLWLFYQLACFSEAEGNKTLNNLRRVRVLKLYSEVFEATGECQAKDHKPDFQQFVQLLRDEGRLRMKKNWHDVR